MLWDVSWDQNNVINGQRYSEYAFKELGYVTVPPTQAPPPPVTTQAPPPPVTTEAPLPQGYFHNITAIIIGELYDDII